MLFNIRMIHLGISTSTSPTMSPPPDAVESKLPAGDCCFVSALGVVGLKSPEMPPSQGRAKSVFEKGTAIALSGALMILPEDESRRVGAVVATAASWIRTVKRHINVLIFARSLAPAGAQRLLRVAMLTRSCRSYCEYHGCHGTILPRRFRPTPSPAARMVAPCSCQSPLLLTFS